MFQETCGEVSVPTVNIILPHRASSSMENLPLSSMPRTLESHQEMICGKIAHTQKEPHLHTAGAFG